MFTYCKESECNLKVESGEEMLRSFRVRLYIHNFSFTIYIHNYQFQFTFYIVFTNHNFNSILKFTFTIIKTCVHLFDACLKVYAGDAQVVTAPQETRTCPEVWDQMNSWNPV